MSVAAILERGGDAVGWSVAAARKHLRQTMRRAVGGRTCRISLHDQLAEAMRDGYKREGSKKARNWPHKKKEKPPGEPKIVVASAKQIKQAKRLVPEKTAA